MFIYVYPPFSPSVWHQTNFRAVGSHEKSLEVAGIKTQDLSDMSQLCKPVDHYRSPG